MTTTYVKGEMYNLLDDDTQQAKCIHIITSADLEDQEHALEYIDHVVFELPSGDMYLYKPDGTSLNDQQPNITPPTGATSTTIINPAMPMDPAALGQAMLTMMSGGGVGGVSEERIKELIAEEGKKFQHTVEINDVAAGVVKPVTGVVHPKFNQLLEACNQGLHVMLVGPAGSGKTHAAHMAAEALKRDFYSEGSVLDPFTLTGYKDAGGKYQTTAFRKSFEKGGVMLFDEFDAYDPNAALVVNQALANSQMNFPDKAVKRHDKFISIAACNTFGRGADRQYVGRNQMDAASLDRYVVIEWDYDTAMEYAICDNEDWVKKVHRIREVCEAEKERLVVSVRAIMSGAKLLAAGWDEKEVLHSTVFKGTAPDTVTKIAKKAGVTI